MPEAVCTRMMGPPLHLVVSVLLVKRTIFHFLRMQQMLLLARFVEGDRSQTTSKTGLFTGVRFKHVQRHSLG